MMWPKEFGGRGLGPLSQAVILSELVKANVPAGMNWAGLEIGGPAIFLYGSEEQKKRFLPPILTAEELWCQLYSEPNAGSDLASLRTKAVDMGDHFLVNGQKTWTSDGLHADYGLLLARTSGDGDPISSEKRQGISAFILNLRLPGVTVRPITQITGHKEFCEVFFDNVRVPRDLLVGQLGQGWKIANATFVYERGTSMLARITRYRKWIETIIRAARTLHQGGKALIDRDDVKHRLGSAYAQMEVHRYATQRLLADMERGNDPGAKPSVIKLSCSEFERELQDLAQSILGPWARLLDPDTGEFLACQNSSGTPGAWPQAMLWARAVTIFAGTSEIQRNIIADRLLNLPREPRLKALKAGN